MVQANDMSEARRQMVQAAGSNGQLGTCDGADAEVGSAVRENEILHFGLRRYRLPENSKTSVAFTPACTRQQMKGEGVTNNMFHSVMGSIQVEVA
jgi:hypothetical protein